MSKVKATAAGIAKRAAWSRFATKLGKIAPDPTQTDHD